jgi:hypothetical protein
MFEDVVIVQADDLIIIKIGVDGKVGNHNCIPVNPRKMEEENKTTGGDEE